jgi:nucleotide-binding universal stress UspA family protein
MDIASSGEQGLAGRDRCRARIVSILAVVDFARSPDPDLQRAALLAAEHGARLTLLHVLDPDVLRPLRGGRRRCGGIEHRLVEAKARLDRLVAALADRHRIDAAGELRLGAAHEEIVRAAHRADLLVLGARRANPLCELLLGTPAERLLRTVRRPVLVVRRPPERPYRRVLVPLDFAAGSERALQFSARLAPQAGRHVVHAIDGSWEMKLRAADVPADVVADHRTRARLRACRRLHAVVADRLGPGGVVGVAVRQGDAASMIVAEAGRLGADLLVMGQDGHSALATFLLGSVVQRVLQGARCDTLVVPRPAASERATPGGGAGEPLASAAAAHGAGRPAAPRREVEEGMPR